MLSSHIDFHFYIMHMDTTSCSNAEKSRVIDKSFFVEERQLPVNARQRILDSSDINPQKLKISAVLRLYFWCSKAVTYEQPS